MSEYAAKPIIGEARRERERVAPRAGGGAGSLRNSHTSATNVTRKWAMPVVDVPPPDQAVAPAGRGTTAAAVGST